MECSADVHPGEFVVFVAAPHELATEHPEIVAVPSHCLARQLLVQQVEDKGGSTVLPRTPMGDMGAFAYFKDTEGNLLGLWETV